MEERQIGYILFPNHTEAMELYRHLKAQNIRCTLAPTPRACSVCCGVSVRLEHPEDIPAVEACVAQTGVAIQEIVTLALSQAH